MLYRPEFFEPLTETPWDEARVRGQIDAIVQGADISATYGSTLHDGASGLIWALNRLGRDGLAGEALRALEAWRVEPDYAERLEEPPIVTHASLSFGETGPLYVAWLLTRDERLADDLYARVHQNEDVPGNGFMRGSVGTLRVAKTMHERTGDERWEQSRLRAAEVLLARRDGEGLWENPPFGRGLGAAHGASTTAALLGDAEATAAALAKYAVVEDGLANWPMVAEDDLVAYDDQIRVQWCHGGAGVASSAAGYLDEDLLVAAAETCWQAGPPDIEKKGPGLCHGTAGTGYALLRVFGRTQDEKWLDRARRFAVHALEQVERSKPRHSLFDGGIGAGLLAQDCLDVHPQFPIVDVL